MEQAPKHVKPWEWYRGQADDVQELYAEAERYEGYARRMAACAGSLLFEKDVDTGTGEVVTRIRTSYCRLRHCPICQWRRRLLWLARFHLALPTLQAQYSRAKWVMLTLTIRNCAVGELRETITKMNASWRRLTARMFFQPVLGWIRATEVTRGKDGSAHPHFRCMLLVPPKMLAGRDYVRHADWVRYWGEAMRVDYAPVVDVRSVRGRGDEGDAMSGAREVLKFATKPSDLAADAEWLYAITEQAHNLRFIATGGAVKTALGAD